MRGRRQETQKRKGGVSDIERRTKEREEERCNERQKKKGGMKRRKQVTCELHSDAAKTWYQ